MNLMDPVPGPGTARTYQRERFLLQQEYTNRFLDDFARQQEPVYGFHIWGLCPRCGHPSSGLVPTKYLRTSFRPGRSAVAPIGVAQASLRPAVAPAGAAQASVRSEAVPARVEASQDAGHIDPAAVWPGPTLEAVVLSCHCLASHDQKSGNIGCGAEWMMAFDYTGKPTAPISLWEVDEVAAAQMWVAADAVSASVVTASQTAMGLAGKWVAALSTTVAVITIAGVIGGHDTIQELPFLAEIALGLGALVGFGGNP